MRDRADAVDMAGDEVAAEPVVRAQRLLEIDSPGSPRPAVLFRLSRETSTSNEWAVVATTVMQAPLIAMLSPSCTSSR